MFYNSNGYYMWKTEKVKLENAIKGLGFWCLTPLSTYFNTNHHDRCITHLSDLDISFVLVNISSKFHLHLECYLLSPKRHIKTSITVSTAH